MALDLFYRLEACGVNLLDNDCGTGYSGLDYSSRPLEETVFLEWFENSRRSKGKVALS
ncbi:hypothetical protein [Marinomonas sp. 2405UD68-3]|uniref:hypothetical protein n=1 Tax=Marinomonas sp. 2405UD68-3 TaxID=3391835 RepID=UPI0039C96C64